MKTVTPATHSWRGSTGKLKYCTVKNCKALTTGELKDIATGKKQAFCSACAIKAGF